MGRRKHKKLNKHSADKDLGMMDKVLIFVGALIIIFTVVMIITFYRYGAIPDTLCTCVFAACTGEAGFMGIIQATKNKYLDRKWQKEDQKEELSQQTIEDNETEDNTYG